MVGQDPVVQRVHDYVVTHRLCQRGHQYLLGVSGGLDSMVMLHMMMQLRHMIGFKIMVAHLNHGLRSAAKNDQQWVKDYCLQHHIPFKTRTLPSRKNASSLEDYARQKRLAFFKEVVRQINADGVMLAHHQDDVAETMLLHLLQGAGMAGLRGMLPRRDVNGVTLLRPLLDVSRSDITTYAQQHQLSHVHDDSNDDVTLTRNRVRHQLIPLINKTMSMDVAPILARNACLIADDYDVLKEMAIKQFNKAVAEQGDQSLRLNRRLSQRAPQAIRRMVYRLVVDALLGEHHRVWSEQTLQAIESVWKSRREGFTRDLGEGLVVTCDDQHDLCFFVSE